MSETITHAGTVTDPIPVNLIFFKENSGAKTFYTVKSGESDSSSDDYILKAGERGNLAGYETAESSSETALTISAESSDSTVWLLSSAGTLTFTPAGTDYCAVKVVYISAQAAASITVDGATWVNNGSAPSWGTSGEDLILLAHFIYGKVYLAVYHNSEA